MHAASREALDVCYKDLDARCASLDSLVAVAAQTGTELFDAVDVLDSDRSLRVAVADNSSPADRRSGLVQAVFGGKVSQLTLDILAHAAAQNWSTPREMRVGIVAVGRRALLASAKAGGQLNQVEDELFRLGRILDGQPQLTSLLADKTASAQAKRSLLAQVLYGKVTAVTEALALQVIGRPESNPIDDISALAANAAALQDKSIAFVRAASDLSDEQKAALADKLGRIYGRAMSVHSEVDTSLLGGAVIRVGDEVIDGSLSGKIDKLRSNLV